jgi:hypothetical protein
MFFNPPDNARIHDLCGLHPKFFVRHVNIGDLALDRSYSPIKSTVVPNGPYLLILTPVVQRGFDVLPSLFFRGRLLA